MFGGFRERSVCAADGSRVLRPPVAAAATAFTESRRLRLALCWLPPARTELIRAPASQLGTLCFRIT